MPTTSHDEVFARIKVDYVVSGGASVSWEMNRHFTDPLPYSFQLQFSRTTNPGADDWTNVGSPVVDTFFAIDLEKRLYGKTQDVHYRVVLTTDVDTYISRPVNTLGLLNKRDWLIWRELLRKEQLRHSKLTSPYGYLLKARRYGPPCPVCLDPYTEEIGDSNCTSCYATGYDEGYFAQIAAYADLTGETVREHRDGKHGTVGEHIIEARFLGDIQLYSYDVWINAKSDERYYISSVKTLAQYRGIPIVYQAELALAPYSDVLYSFPITDEDGAQSILWEQPEVPKQITLEKPSYLDLLRSQRKTR